MADFQPALHYTLNWEDPKREYRSVPDVGGHALAGINSHYFPQQFAIVSEMALEERPAYVAGFYQDEFWHPMNVAALKSQDLANRVLDFGVNDGPKTAILVLQQAVNDCGGLVRVDGVLGPVSAWAANDADQQALLDAFRKRRVAMYEAKNDPELLQRGAA